jgi:hypothetical protein
MESIPEHEPKVEVYEAPDRALEVVIRTIDDDELKPLLESGRRALKRVH